MKKTVTLITTVAIAFAMAASITACSGGSTPTVVPTIAPAETPTVPPDKVKDTPTIAEIKNRGTLKVATGTYVPFEYRDAATDKIVGFDIDFAQIIADKLGVTLSVTDMTFTSIIPTIEKGEYDLAIAAMYDNPARREVVLMSDSYMATGMVLVTKAGNEKGITSLKDCSGLKVAVKAGATSEKVAQDAMAEYGVTYEIVGYEETVGCVSDLVTGRVDVVVNDLLNQLEMNKTIPQVEIVTEPFTHANLSIAVKKGNEDLMDFVNKTIAEYKSDSTYDKLYKKWLAE
jgi:ABC-type amino acid transport substrate-binding protein